MAEYQELFQIVSPINGDGRYSDFPRPEYISGLIFIPDPPIFRQNLSQLSLESGLCSCLNGAGLFFMLLECYTIASEFDLGKVDGENSLIDC